MKKNFTVRQITEADYPVIYNLIKTAFETARHRDGDEQDYAAGLRGSGNYIPESDLVAETGRQALSICDLRLHAKNITTNISNNDRKFNPSRAKGAAYIIGFENVL